MDLNVDNLPPAKVQKRGSSDDAGSDNGSACTELSMVDWEEDEVDMALVDAAVHGDDATLAAASPAAQNRLERALRAALLTLDRVRGGDGLDASVERAWNYGDDG